MSNFFEAWEAQHGIDEGAKIPAMAVECRTYNLNKPMNLTVFSDMPLDLKRQYLKDLREKHGGRVKEIAHMFGCNPKTVQTLLKENRISYIDKGIKSAGDAAAWCAFTDGYQFPEEPECKEPEDAPGMTEDGRTPETTSSGPSGHLPLKGKAWVDGETDCHVADAPRNDGDIGTAPETQEPPGTEPAATFTAGIPVTAALLAFRVDLAGPMDGVLTKLKTFTELIGSIPVRVTISVDEEE